MYARSERISFIRDGDEEAIELDVIISGSYHAATLTDPECWPELECISHNLTEKEHERLCAEVGDLLRG